MANSVGFHESEDRLSPRTRDLHRALTSLQEELEAIDWYQQRMDAAHAGSRLHPHRDVGARGRRAVASP